MTPLKDVINPKDLKKIFLNITSIVGLNKGMLADL